MTECDRKLIAPTRAGSLYRDWNTIREARPYEGKNVPTALTPSFLKTWVSVLKYVRHFYSEIHFHSLYSTSNNKNKVFPVMPMCTVFMQVYIYFKGFVRMPDDDSV